MKEEEWLPESWAKRALETRAGQGWRGLHLDRELGGKNSGPAVTVERLAKRALFLAAITLASRVLVVLAMLTVFTVTQCHWSQLLLGPMTLGTVNTRAWPRPLRLVKPV